MKISSKLPKGKGFDPLQRIKNNPAKKEAHIRIFKPTEEMTKPGRPWFKIPTWVLNRDYVATLVVPIRANGDAVNEADAKRGINRMLKKYPRHVFVPDLDLEYLMPKGATDIISRVKKNPANYDPKSDLIYDWVGVWKTKDRLWAYVVGYRLQGKKRYHYIAVTNNLTRTKKLGSFDTRQTVNGKRLSQVPPRLSNLIARKT